MEAGSYYNHRPIGSVSKKTWRHVPVSSHWLIHHADRFTRAGCQLLTLYPMARLGFLLYIVTLQLWAFALVVFFEFGASGASSPLKKGIHYARLPGEAP